MTHNATAVRLIAEGLVVGGTCKVICPFCAGGETRESSFSVTRKYDGLAYVCHRASCDARGYVKASGHETAPAPEKPKLNTYFQPMLPLEIEDIQYFHDRFELPDPSEHIYLSKYNEYLLPILNRHGRSRGVTVRQPVWDGLPVPPRTGVKVMTYVPKARIYPSMYDPMQSFYPPAWHASEGTSPLVVVEDQISAIKVASAGLASVALCGTLVNVAKAREWAQVAPDEVLIALDEDATETAFKIAHDWGSAFNNLRVCLLEEDLKDSPIEDILDILGVAGV